MTKHPTESVHTSPTIPGEKIAYTVPEAVHASGISRSGLYVLMKGKELPVVKVGNRTLIRRVDLVQFLEERLAA